MRYYLNLRIIKLSKRYHNLFWVSNEYNPSIEKIIKMATRETYSRTQGVEKYITDIWNSQKYIELNGFQIYAFDFRRKRQILAKNSEMKEFYCVRDGNEIYPIYLDTGFHRFVTINGEQIYTFDKFMNQRYALNMQRKEKIAKRANGDFYYAKYSNGNQFYPIDDLRTEFIYKNTSGTFLIALNSNGEPKAPISKNGKVHYESINGREILYEYNNVPFFGRDITGDQVYPCSSTNNEFYPIFNSEPMIAKNASGKSKYALTNSSKIIFPKNSSNSEFYIDEAFEQLADNFERYILSDVYPNKLTLHGPTEMLINNKLLEKYPLDSNGNEFTNSYGDIISSLGYPITNDSLIIIPNINNKPFIKPGDEFMLKHIKHLLYRPCSDTYDFLTDVKSKRNSISNTYPYKVIDLSNYKIDVYDKNYYIIGGLVIIICILIIFLLK